jgi:hypothetical protein
MNKEVSISQDGKTLEFDVPAILRKLGLEDTEENRDHVVVCPVFVTNVKGH